MSSLERFTIASLRSQARVVTVYVPDNNGAGPLPLLILHDGQNLFEPERAHIPGQHWRVRETADALIAEGRLPPIVIAGIDHLGPGRGPEMTPTTGDKPGMGGAAMYGRFIFEDLLPYLARAYGVRIDVFAMGGSSLGGLVTLSIARQFPGRINRLLVMSPSVWWDRRVILRRLRRAGLRVRPRVWLDAGRHEGPKVIADTRALRDVLAGQAGSFRYYEDPEGRHTEADWARRLPEALAWLYSGDGSEVA